MVSLTMMMAMTKTLMMTMVMAMVMMIMTMAMTMMTMAVQHNGGVCPSPDKLQGLLLTSVIQYYAIGLTFKL